MIGGRRHDADEHADLVRRSRVAAVGRPVVPAVDIAEAEEFQRLFHAENGEAETTSCGTAPSSGTLEFRRRMEQVRREVETSGSYWHTARELAFGARVAWRNSARCIGRLYWQSLKVRDLRDVHTVDGVAQQCVRHLRTATNGGKVRPLISVFPPETPETPAPRIWNEQLVRYAGYAREDGSVLGDPHYRAFTEAVRSYGWQHPVERGAFDVLPLVVETAAEGPHMFALPNSAIHEVPLSHPEYSWFEELGLRWHAVPVISHMRLTIGGVSYPAAPFNGWYMGTEIGARNLADQDRYDLVPVVAERLGLEMSRADTLWRDRALVELNRAVLHSFHEHGVTITDHHTEADRFLRHLRREEDAGRRCPVDWSWIVPPMSGAQTPVFHRYYDSEPQRPEFLLDDDAVRRAEMGGPPRFR